MPARDQLLVNLKRIVLVALAVGLLLAVGWQDLATDAARAPQEFPTPTPSPTPIRPIHVVAITSPRPGEALFGTVAIRGTALIENYVQYQVHISPQGMEEWQWLVSSYDVVRDGVLALLDTTRFPDGFYDLRVRAIRLDGNYNEAFVRGVEIRNANPPTPTPPILDPGSPLPTPSPLETPTPTPAPTPDTTSFVPGGPGLYEPRNGQTLRGYAKIVGTAAAPDIYHRFLRYELYISPAGQENWSWLYSSQEQIWQDTLTILDTTRLANGFYDLRLRIVYRDSNYDEFFVRGLRVDNPPDVVAKGLPVVAITSPRPGSTVAGMLDLVGTIVHPDFQRWELYWSPSGAEEWSFLLSGEYQAVDEPIVWVDLAGFPPGVYDFLLRVVRRDGNYLDYPIRRLHVVLPTIPPAYPGRASKRS